MVVGSVLEVVLVIVDGILGLVEQSQTVTPFCWLPRLGLTCPALQVVMVCTTSWR